MTPTPIVTSALPWLCANKAPASATSALEIAIPKTIIKLVFTPFAFAIRGLETVARIARPTSDLGKETSNPKTINASAPKAMGYAM